MCWQYRTLWRCPLQGWLKSCTRAETQWLTVSSFSSLCTYVFLHSPWVWSSWGTHLRVWRTCVAGPSCSRSRTRVMPSITTTPFSLRDRSSAPRACRVSKAHTQPVVFNVQTAWSSFCDPWAHKNTPTPPSFAPHSYVLLYSALWVWWLVVFDAAECRLTGRPWGEASKGSGLATQKPFICPCAQPSAAENQYTQQGQPELHN